MRRDGSLGQDLVWGLAWTMSWAVFLSLIAGVMIALGRLTGSHPLAELSQEARSWGAVRPLTWGRVLAFYFGGGILLGSLIGVLRPIATKSLWGAMLAGAVCTPVLEVLFFWAMVGVRWSPLLAVGIPFFAFIVGPSYGLAAWYGWKRFEARHDRVDSQRGCLDDRSEAQKLVDDVMADAESLPTNELRSRRSDQ